MLTTFKNFLIEAKFSEDDFNRVLSVFTRRLPKLLGGPIYRYGGPGYVEKVGGGNRITFIFKDQAYGVRYKGGSVRGIDVWSKFDTSRGPDYFIDISKLSAGSIIRAISKLAQIIKNPKEGDLEVTSVNESVYLSEMAKRVDDEAFYRMMVAAHDEATARSASWDQIKSVADKNDVLIPGYVKAQKIGRGLWNTQPGSKGEVEKKAEKSEETKTEKAPILYIKVTAQDPETKRFLPAGDNKAAQELYSKISASLSTDHNPTEKELRDPETLYGHLAQLVEFAAKGTLKSLIVYGGPGSGKTFTIMKVIKDAGLVAGKDYVKLSGKASPVSIYETLFMFRDGGLVIFDDLDSMWGNADATNILKAALDTSPVREISWASANTINVSKMSDERRKELFAKIDKQIQGEDDGDLDEFDEDDEEEGGKKKKKARPEKVRYPSTFDFTGRVIFISNLKKEDFDSAILSRSAKISMDLSPEEVLVRMKKLLPELGGTDVKLERKQELLDHLIQMRKRGELDMVTMREFIKGMNILRSGAPNWKELVQYVA